MTKTALIVGSSGQDGRLLFEYLSENGYQVIGIDQGIVKTNGVPYEGVTDISDKESVFKLIRDTKPSEIYYLAAFHHSSEDKPIEDSELLERSYSVNVFFFIHFLEGIKSFSPETKIFYAASSLIFGETDSEIQNETTPFLPNSIYGITKLDGLMISRFYREKYNLFTSVGILYNHESEYRSEKFISMKIVDAAVKIKQGIQNELVVGDLSAEVDWGYAPDYVDAMHRILNTKKPGDYVVATGQKHSIQDLVSEAFGYLDLEWRKYVKENQDILTRKRKPMIGDAGKLRRETGWEPKTSFSEMVHRMIVYKQSV